MLIDVQDVNAVFRSPDFYFVRNLFTDSWCRNLHFSWVQNWTEVQEQMPTKLRNSYEPLNPD